MPEPVGLVALATASPPFELPQDEVAQVARELFAPRFAGFDRMAKVFQTAGVRRRQAVRPMDWYLRHLDWPERSAVFAEAGLELFIEAARMALNEAGLAGDEIDAVVTVSSTGIATPSLEARAMAALGLRPDVARVPVFGLGCAGGATGLALAARLARAEPGSRVLLVCVELCTLAFRTEELSKADIVATALFGDGAAACILRAGESGFAQVTGCAEHTWPDTLDIMGWRVDPHGLGVVFAQAIPPFARRHMRPAMDSMLAAQSLSVEAVDRFVCHPGGVKVLDALETSLDLGQGALADERAVLAEHGNMSSPTVLFVLQRARQRGLPPRSVLAALGPGFTASTVGLLAA